MKIRRVGIVTPRWYGGLERFLQRGFLACGVECDVLELDTETHLFPIKVLRHAGLYRRWRPLAGPPAMWWAARRARTAVTRWLAAGYDLVLVIKGESIDPVTLDRIRRSGAVTALYLIDQPFRSVDYTTLEFPNIRRNLPRYDHVFCFDSGYLPELAARTGRPAHLLPFACDPATYAPRREPPARREYPASFMGMATRDREEFFRPLADVLTLFGPGWNQRAFTVAVPRGLSFAEACDIYDRSEINLNLTTVNSVNGTNTRTFEVLGTGNFLLTDYRADLETQFELGRELVCYHSQAELRELIAYYRARPEARERIARAGRERVLREHTYDCRAATILAVAAASVPGDGRPPFPAAAGKLGLIRRHRLSPRALLNQARVVRARPAEVMATDPETIGFFLTDRCTHRCRMCVQREVNPAAAGSRRHEPAPELSPALLGSVLDAFPGSLKVLLAGVGEPLLHPEFPALARAATARGRMTTVITNGLLLDEQLPALARIPLYKVAVSVNTDDPDDYRELTGTPPGSWARVVAGIRELAAWRARTGFPTVIGVSYIISTANAHRWEGYLRHALALGADEVALINYLESVVADDWRTLAADDPAVRARLAELAAGYGEKIRIGLPVLRPARPGPGFCRQPFRMLEIDGAGKISACGRLLPPAAAGGNFHRDGRGVWNGEWIRALRRQVLAGAGGLGPPCDRCMGNPF